MEPNMEPVRGGIVYLVPASDVEALSETPIDLFLSPEEAASDPVDEPIEDLLDVNGESYEQAAVDGDGVYRFETLPDGSYFVVWTPAPEDTIHLPGGDNSNVAIDRASLIGMQLDIRVSGQPSEGAYYLGSSTCLGCHALQSTYRTAHNIGLQVPGSRSLMQDVGPWPDIDDGLAQFEAGTTLYYFDCDASSASTHDDPSICRVQVQNPGAGVRFRLNLRRDNAIPTGEVGAYFVEIENAVGAQPAETFDVVLTYGGALGKQQYLSRRTNADGSYSYFLLPLIYNYEGDFEYGTEAGDGSSDDWPWRDYRSDLWYDFETNTLRNPDAAPSPEESFDNNCAGCHMTGYRLDGNASDGWSARAVSDAAGAFDYDGDGRTELINVGCESCHGPGSDHLNPSPTGRFMISPGLLTPGRRAAICGSCHSRPLGIGGGEKGLPLSEENEMPPPGIRRADFAVGHTTRVSGDPDSDFFGSRDAFGHYQQYSDHIRSRHYRNPFRLVTCTGCHSPHANDADIASSDDSGNANALCTTCHSPQANPELYPLTDHVADVTGVDVHTDFGDDAFRCADCHMVPTAKSGAAVPALLDSLPSSAPTFQYYWNDIASHRMTVTRWFDFAGQPDQPIAFTNACGPCHGGALPNTPP
jgi:predicted CXXCH cytochrome family protein